jgi:hypothetical protein
MTSRSLAAAAALLALLPACARARPAPAPRASPAPELAVRTARFVLVANAYVEYQASRARSSPALEASERAILEGLAACSDDPCARRVLADDPSALHDLPEFLRSQWPPHAERARLAIDRAAGLLAPAEDILAARVATQLELTWPEEPLRIVVTATGQPAGDLDPRDAPTLDAASACFEGAAVLECAFVRAALARRAHSGLLLAIDQARASLDDDGKAATRTVARDAVLVAVSAAVRALSRGYSSERHFARVRAGEPGDESDPDAIAWLEREWPRKDTGLDRPAESPADFGARAVRTIATGRLSPPPPR